ncbi:hypothetical protein EI94DRAFT_1695830 [Lactarius quietus]|nr:hypothetical protein EI94DRAFT_1695830 [Lactarius quietus]
MRLLPDHQEMITRIRDLKWDHRPTAPTQHPIGTPLTCLLVWTAPLAAGGSDLLSALGKQRRPPEGCPYGQLRDQRIQTQLQTSQGLPQLQEAHIAGAHLRQGLWSSSGAWRACAKSEPINNGFFHQQQTQAGCQTGLSSPVPVGTGGGWRRMPPPRQQARGYIKVARACEGRKEKIGTNIPGLKPGLVLGQAGNGH